jgi:hypothetical protein
MQSNTRSELTAYVAIAVIQLVAYAAIAVGVIIMATVFVR